MGRWTQYDEDEYRLPAGVKRVGYDADTGRYYFRSGNQLYQGPEGSEFGQLTPVSSAPISISNNDDDDLEATPSRPDGYQPLATDGFPGFRNANSPYRILFPFFLGIGVILLLIWRLIVYPGLSPPPPPCQNSRLYIAQPGDNCWEIAQTFHCPWEEFKELNTKVDCEHLMPGTSICVPLANSDSQV
ncbi:hypothetical protein ONZ45_g2346 [Pleurotus djamor]|nr:hypothetical protein ONZ45_g2346 [Pleurotus djamor]